VKGGRNINLTGVWKKGPAMTAEKALTAEVAWQYAEPPDAGVITAAGTAPASNAATYFEN